MSDRKPLEERRLEEWRRCDAEIAASIRPYNEILSENTALRAAIRAANETATTIGHEESSALPVRCPLVFIDADRWQRVLEAAGVKGESTCAKKF